MRSAAVLLKTCSIYILIFIFILLCSPLFPGIKSAVSAIASVLHFPLENGTTLTLKIEWIATRRTHHSGHGYRGDLFRALR